MPSIQVVHVHLVELGIGNPKLPAGVCHASRCYVLFIEVKVIL